MPLTDKVTFTVQLQNQNRFQIPKKIRWQYKLEPSQLMKVTLSISDLGFDESFLGNMLPDGRVTVSRIVIIQLLQRIPALKASFIEVALEPV